MPEAISLNLPSGVQITGALKPGYERVLSAEALEFVAAIARRFEAQRQRLLQVARRAPGRMGRGHAARLLARDEGHPRGRLECRAHPERSARPPRRDHRADRRKMVINALNSGASVFMADFEDAHLAHLEEHHRGPDQPHAMLAGARSTSPRGPEGKRYAHRPTTGDPLVRPRGWHLPEKHVSVDGAADPASLFDFGLYFFHNAQSLLDRGTGPYFYLPKLESHLEARLWNDVFRVRAGAARHPGRHHQGHGADRDDPGRVRDGRDPLRAARALRRPQLRPLGLHLQLHQEVPQPPGLRAARPRPGDDDHAISCAVRRSC